MTDYAGQKDGKIGLLDSEQDMNPELFFTERDRKRATNALRQFYDPIPQDLYDRFEQISKTKYGHQAEYFMKRFNVRQEAVAQQSHLQIERGDAGPGLQGTLELGPHLGSVAASSGVVAVEQTPDTLTSRGIDPSRTLETE